MKKTILSDEALATIMGAESEEAAPAEEQKLEEKAEEVVETEASEEEVVEEEVDATEKLQEEFDAYKAEADQRATDLEAELAESNQKLEAVESNAKALKEIVAGQISKMRLALKVAAVDMTEWSADAIVNEYNSTSESFMKALPVGSVIPEEKKKAEEARVINSSVDASAYKALGIK